MCQGRAYMANICQSDFHSAVVRGVGWLQSSSETFSMNSAICRLHPLRDLVNRLIVDHKSLISSQWQNQSTRHTQKPQCNHIHSRTKNKLVKYTTQQWWPAWQTSLQTLISFSLWMSLSRRILWIFKTFIAVYWFISLCGFKMLLIFIFMVTFFVPTLIPSASVTVVWYLSSSSAANLYRWIICLICKQ